MYKWHKDNVPNPEKTQYDKKNRAWYDKRNNQLLADKQTNTYRKLMGMYGLTNRRLQQLIRNQSNKFKGI